jgi:hypothetical protein
MRNSRFWFFPGLVLAGLITELVPRAIVSPAPQAKDEKPPIEVLGFDFAPRNTQVGDEITVTATIRNMTSRVLLANIRLLLPEQVTVVVPDIEQIVFLEGLAQRDVKWRAKVVAAGQWSLHMDKDEISQGRPLSAPSPDLPGEAKTALGKAWIGTWSSPAGYVYDAEMQVQLDSSGAVEGRIAWTLKKAPEARKDYAGKVGQRGVEYVWGFYDPATRHLDLNGYRRDDPKQILGLDKYRLTFADKYQAIKGDTWNHGTWKAAFSLAPK